MEMEIANPMGSMARLRGRVDNGKKDGKHDGNKTSPHFDIHFSHGTPSANDTNIMKHIVRNILQI